MTAAASACCRVLYGDPLVELLLGESLHPGGLDGTRRLLAATSLAAGSRLLDTGCGSGASSRLAAGEFGLMVEGVDVSRAAIRRARERTAHDQGAVRFRTGDLTELPYPAARFDAVLTECVLPTLPKQAALTELRRVLRPGGYLLLSDVRADEAAIDQIPANIAVALCLGGAWRADEVTWLLADSGFRVGHRWDQDELLESFAERVVTRLDLLRVAGRDLDLDMRTLAEALGAGMPHRGMNWRGALGEIGRTLANGRLGYFSLVARAV